MGSAGCGAPQQPLGPPPPAIAPALAPTPTSPAPSTAATPSPTLPPLPLAADQGAPLGSPPSTLVSYCSEHGASVARSVTSNRGFVHCRNLPPPMIEALGWYCGDGLTEDARLCRMVQTSEPVPKGEAAEGFADWAQTLSARFGPPTEQTEADTVWAVDRQRISLFSDLDKTTSQYVTGVMYEAFEARGALSGQAEFPTQLGPFEFGMTRADAKQTCKRQRGLFIDVRVADNPGFTCLSLKGDAPMAFSGIGGLYCDGRLCELSLDVSESGRRALLLMATKYGEAPPSAEENPRCGAGAKRYTWQWSRDDELVGLVRLVDDCSPVVYYDSAEGWKLRMKALDHDR